MYHSYSYSSSSSYHFHPALIFLIAFFLIITLVAYWRVFVKAGEPGWKAIIPIYNIIIIMNRPSTINPYFYIYLSK